MGARCGRAGLCGALGYASRSHNSQLPSNPRQAPGQGRGSRAGLGLLRGRGVEAGLPVCMRVPVCAVLGGGLADRKEKL